MYNLTQFSSPMQPALNFSSPVQQQLANSFALSPPAVSTQDPNSNVQQSFQPASSQFNVSGPVVQTFKEYPQVQTQIALQGMPPLNINTARIDLNNYSIP